MRDAYILTGVRTPFGKFMGGLSKVSAVQLAAHVTQGALARGKIDPAEVDQMIFGNVIQSSQDAIYLARHAGLHAGVPIETPAHTLNRLCGSGLEAINQAARLIQTKEAELVVAGGAENMTQVPHLVRGGRFELRLGSVQLEDYLWEALLDPYCGCTMAGTASNLAKQYDITREAQDAFALRSQQCAAEAVKEGRLSEEILPVEVKTRKGVHLVDKDEHPRAEVSLEGLAKLPLAPFEGNGCVTAGNASGINDGAAAVVLASKEKAQQLGVSPMARMVSWAVCGVDPSIMGIGPAPASRQALKVGKLALDDLDRIEINEAFAAQYLAVEQELGLDRDKVNLNGGAIALGHPLGASGARLALTLVHELRRSQKSLGLASLCIGGGQGIATIIEAV